MATLLLTHPAFIEHDTGPGHPERADRMRAIDKVLAHESYNALERAEAPLRLDAEEEIRRVHPAEHLAKIKGAAELAKKRDGSVHLDGDTVMSPGTYEAAIRAVGAGLEAVDEVMSGRVANAFCQVRPPGHHAEADRAMGFCLFSNAAIAAHYARARHGAERVAVVDFDVHHGNGTQDIFWSDKNLFYGSTHQMPLFPGTGALSETGVGNIWNAPLREGDAGETFRDAFTNRILGPLHNFSPDLIVISAGFDAHKRDPLGGLRLVEADFMWA
ncbi:MAG: histone deacetylase family protein, partial [Hyphomicrobium sp.]|nr:histone deacetylase family protein [Hyphomicrobium sp.]